MTWSGKVMMHISLSVSSAWAHLWCFHCSSLSLSKVIGKKLLVTFQRLNAAVAIIFTRLQPSASRSASLPGNSSKKRQTSTYLWIILVHALAKWAQTLWKATSNNVSFPRYTTATYINFRFCIGVPFVFDLLFKIISESLKSFLSTSIMIVNWASPTRNYKWRKWVQLNELMIY